MQVSNKRKFHVLRAFIFHVKTAVWRSMKLCPIYCRIRFVVDFFGFVPVWGSQVAFLRCFVGALWERSIMEAEWVEVGQSYGGLLWGKVEGKVLIQWSIGCEWALCWSCSMKNHNIKFTNSYIVRVIFPMNLRAWNEGFVDRKLKYYVYQKNIMYCRSIDRVLTH